MNGGLWKCYAVHSLLIVQSFLLSFNISKTKKQDWKSESRRKKGIIIKKDNLQFRTIQNIHLVSCAKFTFHIKSIFKICWSICGMKWKEMARDDSMWTIITVTTSTTKLNGEWHWNKGRKIEITVQSVHINFFNIV